MTRANLLVLALGVALAIAAGVSVYLAVQLAGQASPQPTEVALVVSAATDIPAGTTFDTSNAAALVRVARVPADQVDQQTLTSPLALLGRATIAPVRSGEILGDRHLSPATGTSPSEGLSARLEQGYVAVALPANDAISVAGAVRAMDRVDLIASVPVRRPDGTQTVLTQAIVRDARVLAVGGQPGTGQGARPSSPSTLTLALTPQDALVVEHLVQANVRVVLALRRSDDQAVPETSPVTMEDIIRRLGAGSAQPTAASASPSPPSPTPAPRATP